MSPLEPPPVDPSWRGFLTRRLGVCLFLILVAAVRSDGYHHPDEYFQTLEFAGTKLGRTPVQELPWEYSAHIRPWLQPALYSLGARAWGALGVEDPFVWTGSFRVLSGLLTWLAIAGLALCVPRWFQEEDARRAAVGALCLAWFVPYLAVRTSSECLASSCLTLGLVLLVLGPSNRDRELPPAMAVLVGVLFGLAFEFRFAIGIAVASILAWAILVARMPVRRLAWIGLGTTFVVVACAFVDRWGYGQWVFPSYEYFAVNLLEGRAAERFGSLPWYGYVVLAAEGPTGPLVLLLMALAVCGWLRRPFHPLTWAGAPFVVLHSWIAHKEMRFLFPVATFALVSAVQAVAPLGDRWDPRLRGLWSARRHPIARFLLWVNGAALLLFCVTPTRPQIEFQRFVWHHDRAHFEGYLLTPYSPWESEGLGMYFYRPKTLHLHTVKSLSEIEELGLPRFMLVTGSFDGPDGPRGTYSCVALYRSLPFGLEGIVGERIANSPAWNLYRCVAPVKSGASDEGSPSGLRTRPGTKAVAEAEKSEVGEGGVDLLGRQLRGRAGAVAEVDRDLADAEAVDPGLIRHLSVDDVPLHLDPVEVRRFQDLAAIRPVAARGVPNGHSGHEGDVLVGEPREGGAREPPLRRAPPGHVS